MPAEAPAASPAAAAAEPATTLATASAVAPAAAAPADDAAKVEAAAKAEAERVAALSPEAKAAEETAAKAKTEAEAKTKAEADAKAETERRAKLTDVERAAEDKAKAEADAKAKADQVPEKYDLKTPDGITLDAEVAGEFEAAAKEMGLSQAKAQALFDIGVKSVQKNTTALLDNVKTMQAGWLETAKNDKEFGGENLDKNMAVAKTALKYATPELVKILNDSRLGDHPEMIRWMFRVGKAMAEDTFVTGQRPLTREQGEQAIAKRLYPNQN